MHEARGTDGTVTFDGEWLTIQRRGFMSLTKGGRGDTRLNVGQISGVDMKQAGLTAGRFQILAAGAVQRGAGLRASRSDPLTIMFQRGATPAFTELRDVLEAAIADRSRPSPGPAPAGVADQLAQLVQLHDTGALSDEEFAAAKARALAG